MLTVDADLANDDWTKLREVSINGQRARVPETPMQTALLITELREQLELQRRAIIALHNDLETLKQGRKTECLSE